MRGSGLGPLLRVWREPRRPSQGTGMLLGGRALGPRGPRVLAFGWRPPVSGRVARVLKWEVLRGVLLLIFFLVAGPPVVPRLIVVLLRAAKTQQQLAGYRRDRPFVRLLLDHHILSRHDH